MTTDVKRTDSPRPAAPASTGAASTSTDARENVASPARARSDDRASGSGSADEIASASRWQHLLPGTSVLLLALVVAWISFTAEPAAAFVFPRLIAVVLLALAVWNVARAAMGLAKVGSGVGGREMARVLPGLSISVLLCFLAARWLGFYTAGFVAYVLLYAAYDPAPHTELRTWVKRVGIAFSFMAVIYALFSLLLRVQTPRGWLF